MFTITASQTAGDLSNYFDDDENDEFSEKGEWTGRGAEELGLEGEIDHNDLISVLNGQAPEFEMPDDIEIQTESEPEKSETENEISEPADSEIRETESDPDSAFAEASEASFFPPGPDIHQEAPNYADTPDEIPPGTPEKLSEPADDIPREADYEKPDPSPGDSEYNTDPPPVHDTDRHPDDSSDPFADINNDCDYDPGSFLPSDTVQEEPDYFADENFRMPSENDSAHKNQDYDENIDPPPDYDHPQYSPEDIEKMQRREKYSGQQLRDTSKVGTGKKSRGGVDIVFSVPKSLSIVSATEKMKTSSGEISVEDKMNNVQDAHKKYTDKPFMPESVNECISDEKIKAAYDNAVTSAFGYIEKNYARAVVRSNGEKIITKTGNLTAARFDHMTNRENEPQQHSHLVVMNTTQGPDKKWRALHERDLFRNVKEFGHVFRNDLAKNLQEAGFELKITDRSQGFFELKGVDKELINEFSTRREQVLEKAEELKENGYDTKKLKKIAALASRPDKTKFAPDEKSLSGSDQPEKPTKSSITENWVTRIGDHFREKYGLSPDHTQSLAETGWNITPDKAVSLACQVSTEKESVFQRRNIIETAGKLSLGKNTKNGLQTAFDKHLENGLIIRLGEKDGFSHFTTAEMHRTEQDIVRTVSKSKNTHTPLHTEQDVEKYISETEKKQKFRFAEGQKKALSLVATDHDRVNIIHGSSGTGKTELAGHINKMISQKDIDVYGTAFSANSVSDLKEAGINSLSANQLLSCNITFRGGLLKKEKFGRHQKGAPDLEIKKGSLLIIDGAGMIGSRQSCDLQKMAETGNMKVVILGDPDQKSFSAGRVQDVLLKRTGVKKTELTEAARQKSGSAAWEAVIKSKKDGIGAALHSLKEKGFVTEADFKETENEKGRKILTASDSVIEKTVNIALEAKKSGGKSEKVLMTAGKKDYRDRLNLKMREKLAESGEISTKRSRVFKTSESVFMSGEDRLLAKSYKRGQKILINDDVIRGFSGKAEIIGVNANRNYLTVQTPEGTTADFNLSEHQHRGVYEEKEIGIAKGDRILLQRAHDRTGIKADTFATVKTFDRRGNITAFTDDGDKIKFNGDSDSKYRKGDAPKYTSFDYGHAVTNHKASPSDTIVSLTGSSDYATQNSLDRIMSMAEKNIRFVVDDTDKIVAKTLLPDQKSSVSDYKNHRGQGQNQNQSGRDDPPDRKMTPDRAVMLACHIKTNSEAVFTKKMILTSAMKHSFAQHSAEDLQRAFGRQLRHGNIVSLGSKNKTDMFTTREAEETEKKIVQMVSDSENQYEAFFTDHEVRSHLNSAEHNSGRKFTKGQRDAVTTVLTSSDRVNIIQGDAGTGKTAYTYQVMSMLGGSKGINVIGVGFTGKSKMEMINAGIKNSVTINSLLSQNISFKDSDGKTSAYGKQSRGRKNLVIPKGSVIIMDEASMTGNAHYYKLVEMAMAGNLKLVAQGDTKQFPSPSAGKAFSVTQEHTTADRAELTESVRHTPGENAWKAVRAYEKTVADLTDKNGNTATDRIKLTGLKAALTELDNQGNIREVPKSKEGLETMKKTALEMSETGQTFVLTYRNDNRENLNNAIRSGLSETGKLDTLKEYSFRVLGPSGVSGEKASLAESFIKRPKQGKLVLDLQAGAIPDMTGRAEIKSVNTEKNTLTVENSEGMTGELNLSEKWDKFNVHREEKRSFAPGDRIVFLKNRGKTISNGETGVIKSIDDKGNITAQVGDDENSRTFKFNADTYNDSEKGDHDLKYNNFDHAYAVTYHKSQGGTSVNCIAGMGADDHLISPEAVYVALTRAKANTVFFTDDKAGLFKKIDSWIEKGVWSSKTSVYDNYEKPAGRHDSEDTDKPESDSGKHRDEQERQDEEKRSRQDEKEHHYKYEYKYEKENSGTDQTQTQKTPAVPDLKKTESAPDYKSSEPDFEM